MTQNNINICVCDIEMPGKSGLDLLSWVRENNMDTLFIFLTSYADFSYAQKAISLSSMDYLLKPIDFSKLSQILEKATAKVRKDAAWSKTQEESEHWATNYQAITDLFWKDLFLDPAMKEIPVLEHKLSQKALPYMPLDIEQIVFSFLQKNGIEAHTLFGTNEINSLITRSVESSTYMEQYLTYLIAKALDYSSFIKEEHSVIDLVLDYIHQHYAEDITRTDLSNLVYLNPDYMARLFKKQTGKSIVNYITEYRIEKAKELLDSPDIPIGIVAAKVGYGNYSYFSKLFKDITGLTPNEYRKKILQ